MTKRDAKDINTPNDIDDTGDIDGEDSTRHTRRSASPTKTSGDRRRQDAKTAMHRHTNGSGKEEEIRIVASEPSMSSKPTKELRQMATEVSTLKDVVKPEINKPIVSGRKSRRIRCAELKPIYSTAFTKEQIVSDPEMERFLKTLKKSSKAPYKIHMNDFCNYVTMLPSELKQARIKELKDLNKESNIERKLRDFRDFLDNCRELGHISPGTVNAKVSCVMGFFNKTVHQGALDPGILKEYELKDVVENEDWVPTLEEFGQILEASDLADRFRFLFVANTSFRPSDAKRILYKALLKELKVGLNPIAIPFKPKKDRHSNIKMRWTFIGTDCIDLLPAYADKMKLEPDDFVLKGYKGRPLDEDRITDSLREAVRRANIDTYGLNVRYYSLRKFFDTQLRNNGAEDTFVDFVMAHKVDKVKERYWQRRPEELRKLYNTFQKHLNPISGVRAYKGNINVEVSQQMQDFAKSMLSMISSADPSLFDKMVKDVKDRRYSIAWDEKKDFKPIPYLIQDAIADILEEGGNNES